MARSKKVFISYSHKDETHKEALEEHLTMLKRNGIIDAWNDRKIIPGQDWSKEISKNLEQSELILFLISPTFLASDYCFNKEMKRAIEMHDEGRAQLIPILVRPCDWSESALSRFQAVPKDAKPITTWQNNDEAWLDAINGIKRHISSFTPLDITNPVVTKNLEFNASNNALEWIDDTEIVFTHPKATKLKLSDVYIALDMEAEKGVIPSEIEIFSSDIVFNKPMYYLIYGEEQQGKTSLLKQAFKQFLKSGIVPIYIDARMIKQSDIKNVLETELKSQYNNLELEQFLAMPNKAL